MAAVLAATLVVGAAVQGLVGLGLGLVAAPVVTLFAPQLMPDLMLWLAFLLPMVTLAREHHQIDWPGLAWSVSARMPGTAVGVAVVTLVSTRELGIVVGVMVLVSVLLTIRAVRVPVTRGTLIAAGFTSGITGTATSIGGPPIAILYQHRDPVQIRSTLAVYFVFGAAFSLVGLGVVGALETSTMFLALLLVPSLVVGFIAARLMHRVVPAHHIRGGVLLVCGLSAVALLVKSLLF